MCNENVCLLSRLESLLYFFGCLVGRSVVFA